MNTQITERSLREHLLHWRSAHGHANTTSHCILRKIQHAETRKEIENILKEGRKVRQGSTEAQASSHASGKAGDNADIICWFCHLDVSNLENDKCAGCRKVYHLGT